MRNGWRATDATRANEIAGPGHRVVKEAKCETNADDARKNNPFLEETWFPGNATERTSNATQPDLDTWPSVGRPVTTQFDDVWRSQKKLLSRHHGRATADRQEAKGRQGKSSKE